MVVVTGSSPVVATIHFYSSTHIKQLLKALKTVKNILIDTGLDAENISLVSSGEHNPLCTESTQECCSQNRRAGFKLRK